MGLDDHRVAGGQRGEEAGVAVPGRERVAADDQRHAAGHDPVVLLHPDRLALGRLLPDHRGRHALLLDERADDRLDGAVLGVRAAGLERHHERLPAGVHHGVRDLEGALVDRVHDLEAHRRTGERAGVPPGGHRRAGGGQRRVDVQPRVAHPQRRAVRRDLVADHGAVARLAGQPAVVLGEVRLEGGLALGRGVLAVDPRRRGLGVAREVRPLGEGPARLLEGLAVGLGQRVHGSGVGGRHRSDRTCVLQFGDTSANMCHMTNAAPGPAVAILGTGAMGSGIAQVAAQAGSPVHLVDAVPGAAARGAGPARRDAEPARRQGPDQPGGRGRRDGPAERRGRGRRPAPVRARDRGHPRGPRRQAGGVRRAGPAAAGRDAAGQQHLEPGHQRHRRRDPTPERVIGLHFFNPAAAHAAGRGRPRHADRPRTYVTAPPTSSAPGARRRSGARPRRGSSSTGWPARSTARRSGCSRRASPTPPPSTRACAVGRVPDGAARADRPHRPGRQPRCRHARLGADRPGPPVCAGAAPARPRQRGPARPQDRARRLPYAADGRPQEVAPDEEPASPSSSAGRSRTDPVARTLAMLVNEAVDLVAPRRGEPRGRRHGHACWAPTTRGGRSSGGPRSAWTWSRSSWPTTTQRSRGGRYRPSPALAYSRCVVATGTGARHERRRRRTARRR